jgi:hypothetical protein
MSDGEFHSALPTVRLSLNEFYLSAIVGVRRRMACISRGNHELRGLSKKAEAEQWFCDIIGAVAEMAFAKLHNFYWPASVDAKKTDPDVPPYWQVRWRSHDDYELIIRPDDSDNFRYALMTGSAPLFTYRGWCTGKDGKKDEWFFDRGDRGYPVYWVPQTFLSLPIQHATDPF